VIAVIDRRHCSGVVCTLISTRSRASARLRMGRLSHRRRRRSFRFLLRSRRASLLASVSSMGASLVSSSTEMSSRYRSLAVPEGPGVSPTAMKTWRSGLPRLESELATSVGVYSSARASGVPPGREASRGRRRNVGSRLSGRQACDLASRRISQQVWML
jgi:hypothetical protein